MIQQHKIWGTKLPFYLKTQYRNHIKPIIHQLTTPKPIYRGKIVRPDFPAISPNLKKTLLISCHSYFNQNLPIAGTLMRESFARGWNEVGGPAKLVAANRLMQELDNHENPAVFLSPADFLFLNSRDLRRLRDVDTFVWVGIHPSKFPEWDRSGLIDQDELEMELAAYPKIMLAEPNFVWNAIGNDGLHMYQGWKDDGFKWCTIHPAVDLRRYYPEPNAQRFGKTKMAYVGGYWAEKAQAFDLYLRPWENIFVPYGYATWPYKNYGGRLDEASERQLYSSAGLIPLVTSPMSWFLAELTERYFKVPACKAFCIADHTTAVREVFDENEMLQAENPEHFHHLVQEYLAGNIDTDYWRNQGYQAVLKKHTYRHRAQQIWDALVPKHALV